MAELSEPTRPQNAYWIWLAEHREELTKEAGVGQKGCVVTALGGAKWKALSANAKAPYEKQAQQKKAAYDKAMEEFKAAGGQVGKRRQEKAAGKKERETKKAKKDARKNSGKPKRPPTAYFAWLNAEGRAAIQKELGTTDFGTTTKAAGERWKTSVPAATKAKYEKIAAEAKAEYDKEFKEWKATQANKENADDNDDEEEEEDDE